MRNVYLARACAAIAFLGVLIAPSARAQFVNPYTGRSFNNANSSMLDTGILGATRSMVLSGSLASSNRASIERQMRLGQSRIKSGKATTRYTPREPFPLTFWLKRIGITDPAKRKQWGDESAVQKVLWEEEARSRGADLGDMADALSLTFMLGWEAQTGGEKATPAQFKGVAAGFRKMLLQNAYYQSMSLEDRQTYIEGQLLNASDSVRLLREAKRTGDAATLKQARDEGKRVTDEWLHAGQTHFVPNPTGFTGTK